MTSEITKTETDLEKTTTRAWAMPSVDVLENDDELLLIADLPGVRQEDLDVRYEDRQLRISAEKKTAELTYRRSFRVPQGIDADSISADLDRGVLSIHLPKEEGNKPRQIPISP